MRDKVFSANGLTKIIKVLKTAEKQEMVKQCVWTLSNFCRGKPPLEFKVLKPVRKHYNIIIL